MKAWIKTSLAAALAAAVGIGASTAIAGPWGDCGGPRGGMHPMAQRMGPGAMTERATEHLAQLQGALSLRADQTAAWEAFKGLVQEKARSAADHRQTMRNETAPATAIERMARMERFARERMDSMTEVHQAATRLYAVLDDAQKRTFDQQFGGIGGGGMGRGHMGPGMGPRGAG